ncbi:MAG: Protein serine/threonine phosphatase PrpC, regulation of stationary phase [uncultured Solirubrobacteraceae bacterium]|uniref:Protein serine/threonine phosphatase PrpC, regulation of stationary phase n=1 Tax=uncultured Solirubrobacteraceae bacterium TaxID=1162706 RepID=A0A6J4RFT7_9ACTN|nr:MAG: Protein serine/threonine phosphatase PrpC, regulation of stationary phase [uncultured Solirubrobacteraceae bacterium]
MLRVVEHFADSDVGRQRQGNEDSLFVRSPLFVVADGMGGAQAGEVASQMAVGAFADGLTGSSPAEALVRTVRDANRRIHERSQRDRQTAGMGTTLTAAVLTEGDEVAVAHVGDSRCYLLRDGDLVRLTRDHSLVGELVAQGKLTEEQAEAHPQRSVITRALGSEAEIQVDVDLYAARAGDLFLVCSDGLTSMVPESRIKELLTAPGDLDARGRSLIAAANRAGGRDNITVILFRLGDAGDGGPGGVVAASTARREAAETRGGATRAIPAIASDDRQSTAALDTVPAHDAASPDASLTATAEPATGERSATAEADAPAAGATGEHSAPATGPAKAVEPARAAPADSSAARAGSPQAGDHKPRPRRRRRRFLRALAIFALVLVPLLVPAWMASRVVYFIGVDAERGRVVTIYRGVPYDLPGGVRLYERFYPSGVTIDAVPPARREIFTNHKLRSRDDAEDLVIALERGELNR